MIYKVLKPKPRRHLDRRFGVNLSRERKYAVSYSYFLAGFYVFPTWSQNLARFRFDSRVPGSYAEYPEAAFFTVAVPFQRYCTACSPRFATGRIGWAAMRGRKGGAGKREGADCKGAPGVWFKRSRRFESDANTSSDRPNCFLPGNELAPSPVRV